MNIYLKGSFRNFKAINHW